MGGMRTMQKRYILAIILAAAALAMYASAFLKMGAL